MHARIVGISLVRNEDVFVERALRNVLGFCDEVIVLDDRSTDRTQEVVARLAAEEPKLRYQRIGHPRESHAFVSGYAGERVWVFGVDGDEVYDPVRLAGFREELLGGAHEERWMIVGNMLHCRELDLEAMQASGYLTPPARSGTKLYNFALLESWGGSTPERLHGGTQRFKPGYSNELRYELFREVEWEASPLRVLHTCFLRRSSRQPPWVRTRQNPAERYYTKPLDKLRRDVAALVGRRPNRLGKHESYLRGELVTVDARPFFPTVAP